MLALCLILLGTYYVLNYAGTIGLNLFHNDYIHKINKPLYELLQAVSLSK